jgi:hypothetical protein
MSHGSSVSIETRMCGSVPPLPQYIFMVRCLVKHKDNFTFTSECISKNINFSFEYSCYKYVNKVPGNFHCIN